MDRTNHRPNYSTDKKNSTCSGTAHNPGDLHRTLIRACHYHHRRHSCELYAEQLRPCPESSSGEGSATSYPAGRTFHGHPHEPCLSFLRSNLRPHLEAYDVSRLVRLRIQLQQLDPGSDQPHDFQTQVPMLLHIGCSEALPAYLVSSYSVALLVLPNPGMFQLGESSQSLTDNDFLQIEHYRMETSHRLRSSSLGSRLGI